MKNVVLLFCFLLLKIYGFAQSDPASLIADFNDKLIEMYEEEDFSIVASYYEDDVRLMPEFQATILSEANAEQYYTSFFDRFTVQKYDRKIFEVLDLGSRIFELGTFNMVLSDVSDTIHLEGKYVNIWHYKENGKLVLITEAWNYDHSVDFVEKLKFDKVPSMRMALEGHLPITDNISFELAGLNALMEKVITQHDGQLWSMFYDDSGISLHSFVPMNIGREQLDDYLFKHVKELPIFEKLDIRTDRIDELDGYVIEYATAVANWRMDQYSGVSTSKNIRLWKRQENGTLKILRIIAMYDR